MAAVAAAALAAYGAPIAIPAPKPAKPAPVGTIASPPVRYMFFPSLLAVSLVEPDCKPGLEYIPKAAPPLPSIIGVVEGLASGSLGIKSSKEILVALEELALLGIKSSKEMFVPLLGVDDPCCLVGIRSSKEMSVAIHYSWNLNLTPAALSRSKTFSRGAPSLTALLALSIAA